MYLVSSMVFLDLLFPKKCVSCKKLGSYLCEICFSYLSFDAKNLCLVCDKPSYNNLTHPFCRNKHTIDGCFSALSYNHTAKKLIYSFKYKPYLTDLKDFISELFYESIIQKEEFMKLMADDLWLITPVPLSESKLRKRGYNQAEILAKELAEKVNLKEKDILKRIKETKTQVGRSNAERKLNIQGAFEIHNSKFIIHNTNIFLVDDVVTTGATLLEAAKILKKKGAKRVIGLTLARD